MQRIGQLLVAFIALLESGVATADEWMIGLSEAAKPRAVLSSQWLRGSAELSPRIRAELETRESSMARAKASSRPLSAQTQAIASLWIDVASWGENKEWRLSVGAGAGNTFDQMDDQHTARLEQAGVSLKFQPNKDWFFEFAFTDQRMRWYHTSFDQTSASEQSMRERTWMLHLNIDLEAIAWTPKPPSPIAQWLKH